ncbi:MAG: NAD(P)H-dependent oxidoreductase [Lachnospiraceae bacterium]|nr:NAD(P)H-dependent oxidoreductase [Lachnospiraceae bacterium]
MVFTKVKVQKAICISASNIVKNQKQSTSYCISTLIKEVLSKKNISCEMIDLREFALVPCNGCEGCCKNRRCSQDAEFNRIYEKVAGADYLFFTSPRGAPIPAKLSMLLEKLEKMSSLHKRKEPAGLSKSSDILAGIISYGDVECEVPKDHTSAVLQEKLLCNKAMVNDIIADALNRMNFRTVPYNSKWNTGIALPIGDDFEGKEQIYDQKLLEQEIRQYVEVIVQTSKSLYAIY